MEQKSMTPTPCAANKEIWAHVQRGLVYPVPHSIFVALWRLASGSGKATRKKVVRHLFHDLRGCFLVTNRSINAGQSRQQRSRFASPSWRIVR